MPDYIPWLELHPPGEEGMDVLTYAIDATRAGEYDLARTVALIDLAATARKISEHLESIAEDTCLLDDHLLGIRDAIRDGIVTI